MTDEKKADREARYFMMSERDRAHWAAVEELRQGAQMLIEDLERAEEYGDFAVHEGESPGTWHALASEKYGREGAFNAYSILRNVARAHLCAVQAAAVKQDQGCEKRLEQWKLTHCQEPDRDEPKLICGYPLPCPFHSGKGD